MSIVSSLRMSYCPHCGEPYFVNDNPMYNPLWLRRPCRCYGCDKIIKPDLLGVGEMVGMVKHTKKTLKKIKRFADWLAS